MPAYDELSESVKADLAAIRSRKEKERFLLQEGFSTDEVTAILGPSAPDQAPVKPQKGKRGKRYVDIEKRNLFWAIFAAIAAVFVPLTIALFSEQLNRLGTYLIDCILQFFSR